MADADGLFGNADQSTGVVILLAAQPSSCALRQTHIKQEFHVPTAASGA